MPVEILANPPPQAAPRMRGRSIMALVLAPEFPVADWFAALDAQMRAAPDYFASRPVVADLSGLAHASPDAPLIVLDGLEARELRLVGVEGLPPGALARTPWARLATVLQGRDLRLPPPAARRPEPPRPAPSRLIDRPVRSGQSVVFEAGDLIVLGAVGSGAEVLAGGSIHVYGPLRGRAIAGLTAGSAARIFCRRLEAEMVAVDRLYRTAEHWGPALHGRAVQVFCDRGALRLSPLD